MQVTAGCVALKRQKTKFYLAESSQHFNVYAIVMCRCRKDNSQIYLNAGPTIWANLKAGSAIRPPWAESK